MTEKEIERLSESFQREVEEIFPNAPFGMSSYIGGDSEDSYGGYHHEFSINQKVFDGTSYQINGKKEFIHYTSVESFFSILNSGQIKLSDLNNLNDPREFDYLLNQYNIKIDKRQIEIFKRSLYLFSMCEYDSQKKDDFDMWRLYGNNGNGIGIVFELLNDSYDWYSFLLGRVCYNDEYAEKKIQDLLELTKRYQLKGFNENRIPILIGLLLLYHKNPIWKIENEIRLSSFFEYDPYTLKSESISSNPHFGNECVSFFVNSRNILSSNIFHKLEHKFNTSGCLIDEEINSKIKSRIRLKIKKVIVGYNTSNQFHDKLYELLHCLIQKGFLRIEVEYSKYSEAFK